MTTLHIEHPISDFDTWREAFDRFEPLRSSAGVVADRVYRPVDDNHYVLVQLDFPDDAPAIAFLDTLRTVVWNNPELSPALRGEPRAVVLHRATNDQEVAE